MPADFFQSASNRTWPKTTIRAAPVRVSISGRELWPESLRGVLHRPRARPVLLSTTEPVEARATFLSVMPSRAQSCLGRAQSCASACPDGLSAAASRQSYFGRDVSPTREDAPQLVLRNDEGASRLSHARSRPCTSFGSKHQDATGFAVTLRRKLPAGRRGCCHQPDPCVISTMIPNPHGVGFAIPKARAKAQTAIDIHGVESAALGPEAIRTDALDPKLLGRVRTVRQFKQEPDLGGAGG